MEVQHEGRCLAYLEEYCTRMMSCMMKGMPRFPKKTKGVNIRQNWKRLTCRAANRPATRHDVSTRRKPHTQVSAGGGPA